MGFSLTGSRFCHGCSRGREGVVVRHWKRLCQGFQFGLEVRDKIRRWAFSMRWEAVSMACVVVFAGKAEDAQAGAVGLFGIAAGGQDRFDELGGERADLLPPVQQPLGGAAGSAGGIENEAMVGWHMLWAGWNTCREWPIWGMNCHLACLDDKSPPTVRWRGFRLWHAAIGWARCRSASRIQRGSQCSLWLSSRRQIHRLDFGKRTQGRAVQFFEQLPAGLAQVLHAPIIEGRQQRFHGLVRLPPG